MNLVFEKLQTMNMCNKISVAPVCILILLFEAEFFVQSHNIQKRASASTDDIAALRSLVSDILIKVEQGNKQIGINSAKIAKNEQEIETVVNKAVKNEKQALVAKTQLEKLEDTVIQHQIVCEGNKLVINCPAKTTIWILDAMYGRMVQDPDICPASFSHMNYYPCLNWFSKEQLRKKCENKQKVDYTVNTAFMGGDDPCKDTYKYLDFTYMCVSTLTRNIFCENKHAKLECPSGTTIRIEAANYGRTEIGECPPTLVLNTACINTSTKSVVSGLCDNKQKCEFDVNNTEMKGDPCVDTSKYLDVEWFCAK